MCHFQVPLHSCHTVHFRARWPAHTQVLDVGCGIGGSSRHLARKYNCSATGITLSPVQASQAHCVTCCAAVGACMQIKTKPGPHVQAARGNALANQQGLGERVSFQACARPSRSCVPEYCKCCPQSWQHVAGKEEDEQCSDSACMQVADALRQPFPDASFDLIWSLESGEHMPDKQRFVGELARVCAPGGRIIIVTWCHRCPSKCACMTAAAGAAQCVVPAGMPPCPAPFHSSHKPSKHWPACRGALMLHVPAGARNLGSGESALADKEERLLDQICENYYLPRWCSLNDYRAIFEAQGLQARSGRAAHF